MAQDQKAKTEYAQELLRLTQENNLMLKQIIAYINGVNAQANIENENDFVRNIIANLISSSLTERNLFNNNRYGNLQKS